MKNSNNYTIMLIPDNEKKSRSFYFSKIGFKSFIFFIFLLVASCFVLLIIYTFRIESYKKIEKEYTALITERVKVAELYKNLKRVNQMNKMVRNSLGSALEVDEPLIVKDSMSGLYDLPVEQISYLDNIPSQLPIQGFVSQYISDRSLFLKDIHHGIDIVAKEGEPILASASGVVVFSGWTYDFGNMIIIYHGDDYFTHYGHNKKNLKEQLDIVDRGEIIGLVGSTGISSGPHLHFEIWKDFQSVNPLDYFPEYSSSYTSLQNDK